MRVTWLGATGCDDAGMARVCRFFLPSWGGFCQGSVSQFSVNKAPGRKRFQKVRAKAVLHGLQNWCLGEYPPTSLLGDV